MSVSGSSSWKAKATAKRRAELAKIPADWRLKPEFLKFDETSPVPVLDVPAKCGILTPEEVLVTENFDATSLAKVVRTGSLKAKDVAIAFCKRAAIAQQLTSCLTETFFDDAIKRGEWLDQYLMEHSRPLGPLHGVPISIKDSFNYIGVQSTLGLVSFLDNPTATENSPLVETLLDLGAILYCKTNIPQTLMTADSHNNVFGRTLNPNKLCLGAGGSSGGEGALVALRGSILGVGTDIGGSIRIPAICNGTYGFKPTPNRIPYGNQAFCSRRGSPGFPACAGPLTNSFEDLDLFLRTVLETKPWDRDGSAIAFPWRAEVASATSSKLRIGYFMEDMQFPVKPPVRRGLEYMAQILSLAGHEIIPLRETPSLETANDLTTNYWSFDNSRTFQKHIEKGGEPFVPSLLKGWKCMVKREEDFTLDDVFETNAAKAVYKSQWNTLWAQNRLDVILCPGAQTTAVHHDDYISPPAYTLVWNLLEYPGLIMPLGLTADKDIDRDEEAASDQQNPYNADDIHGAPLTIQLVTRSFQDEELVAAARVIDQTLKIANNTGKRQNS